MMNTVCLRRFACIYSACKLLQTRTQEDSAVNRDVIELVTRAEELIKDYSILVVAESLEERFILFLWFGAQDL